MLPLSQIVSQLPLFSSLLNPQQHALGTDHGHSISSNDHKHAPSISLIKDHSCPNPPTLSCSSPSPPPDSLNTCCINHPSGHFLQTQFWDTSPPVGPKTSWTIHGLWPDLCAGGFDAFCDDARSHSDIRGVLRRALENRDSAERAEELLSFMETYWLSMDGNDENLWAHEWNKHGTCISTLEPDCYSRSSSSSFSPETSRHHHVDVLDYFIHTTSLFRTLDTYSILAAAGILPSHDKRYTLRDLEDAVSSSAHGQTVTFRCNRRGELDEIWYHFSVMGSLRQSSAPSSSLLFSDIVSDTTSSSSLFLNASSVRKHFIPTTPDGIISNCPRRGIKYLPKGTTPPGDDHPKPSPSRTRKHPHHPPPTSKPSPTSTAAPFTDKGFLEVHVLPSSSSSSSSSSSTTEKKGCLIRHGEWYMSGTCATFRSKQDVIDPGHQPLFSLASSYSPCLVNPETNRFECSAAAAVQGIFSASKDDDTVLAYQNQSVFYAEKVPRRFEKVDVFADDAEGQREVQLEIHWVSV